MVHQLHKGRQSEGQQVAETKRRRTHRDTHRKLLCGRWPEAVSRCNAQMAQNITGNERSAEARGGGGARGGEGAEDHGSRSATRPTLNRRRKTGKEEETGKRLAMQCGTHWPSRNGRGPSEGQQEPGGTARRSIGTRKLQKRVKSCWFEKVPGEINCSASVAGGRRRERIKQLLCTICFPPLEVINEEVMNHNKNK